MTATAQTNITPKLASFFADVRLGDVSPAVVERAKYLMLDGFGCALSGVTQPPSELSNMAFADLETGGTATVWGRARKATPLSAAVLNATAVQAWEMDDYHLLGTLHGASVVLPSAIATAEHIGGVSGSDLLISIICGQEIGPRIGMAMGGIYLINLGWHNGAIFGAVASGVASAKVRKLSAAGFEDAIGLSATQACGLMAAQYEAMVTYMHHGFSARSGVLAASLAQVGFTGSKNVIEREYGGLISTFSRPNITNLTPLLEDLGSRWEIDRIAIKPYACMAGIHLPIEAAVNLLRETGKSVDDITSITFDVPKWLQLKGAHPLTKPIPTVAAQMSIAYGVAVALLDGDALPAQYSHERIHADDVWSVSQKISVVHDPTMDNRTQENAFACRMHVRFAGGLEVTKELLHPLGSHMRPLSNDQIAAKFETVLQGIVTPARRERLRTVTLGIESYSSSDLVEVLAEPVAGV